MHDLQVVLDAVMDLAEQYVLFFQRGVNALLSVLAIRNVHDGREHHRSFVRLDRIQADLDGELAAVFLEPI